MWGNKNKFKITDIDKEWVHENFEWLLKVYGYPAQYYKTILFTEEFFPDTLAHKHTAIEPLLNDLCRLLSIDRHKISTEKENDIRDAHEIPYELQGRPFESDLEVVRNEGEASYKLFIANFLLRQPKSLLFNCLYQCLKIRMLESNIEGADSKHAALLIYFVGIYLGYGVLIAQSMSDEGRHYEGSWVRKWNKPSDIPAPVMAYSLALYYSLFEEKNPDWKNFLPGEIKKEYDKAVEFINTHSNPFFNKQELTAKSLLSNAHKQHTEKDFDGAIETYQKVIFLTKDIWLLSLTYNNIGYAQLWKKEYQKSIANFQKALELHPNFGYANDNLGFAFIMTGDTESGRYYLSLALQTNNNDHAYSHRNMALYHQKKGETIKAKENFKKAFGHITQPVDFLEYFYARFLFEQGETEEAIIYLQMAVEKGEPEAIGWLNEINGAG